MAPWEQDKAEGERGMQRVGVVWHDTLSIISEAVTFTRGSRRGAAPRAVQGFVMCVLFTSKEAE